MNTLACSRRQCGMTLIEVLVALLVFSFGLLGLIGLQARAVQISVSAEDTNRASLLANDLAAEMRMQNTVSLPSATVSAWAARVATPASGGLPNGVGAVSNTGGTATITVTWRPPAAAASAQDNRYVTQVVP